MVFFSQHMLHRSSLFVAILLGLSCIPLQSQSADMKHWELDLSVSDADLSPDDRMLAVTLGTPLRLRRGDEVVESIEVWNYREQTKAASTVVATYRFAGIQANYPVRFTADGTLLVVADVARIHVLTADTLAVVRLIDPVLPAGFAIGTLETSPVGHSVVVAANNSLAARLLAYDLDTGQLLFEWNPSMPVRSIAWKPDGTQFAIAPSLPCASIGNNVHVFGTKPWAHLQALTAKNALSLAFSNSHLYSAQGSFCKGSVFNHHLGLEVFETEAWHQQRTVYLRKRDIHDYISFANGRMMANTGTVATKYDWGDFASFSHGANLEFTVWDGDPPSVVFTSPTIQIMGRLRLSRSGKMVIVYAQTPHVFHVQKPQVFQLP